MYYLNGVPVNTNVQQTISAATGTVNVGTDICLCAYTSTAAMTAITFSSSCVSANQKTLFVDTNGNAGTKNITIKNSGGSVIGIICEDGGTMTVISDGSNTYVS